MNRKTHLAKLSLLAVLPLGAISAEPAQLPGGLAVQDIPALATPAANEEPAPLFRELDSNHDDYVTREEARRSPEVTARFNKLDIDQDGKISVVEFKNGMQSKL